MSSISINTIVYRVYTCIYIYIQYIYYDILDIFGPCCHKFDKTFPHAVLPPSIYHLPTLVIFSWRRLLKPSGARKIAWASFHQSANGYLIFYLFWCILSYSKYRETDSHCKPISLEDSNLRTGNVQQFLVQLGRIRQLSISSELPRITRKSRMRKLRGMAGQYLKNNDEFLEGCILPNHWSRTYIITHIVILV